MLTLSPALLGQITHWLELENVEALERTCKALRLALNRDMGPWNVLCNLYKISKGSAGSNLTHSQRVRAHFEPVSDGNYERLVGNQEELWPEWVPNSGEQWQLVEDQSINAQLLEFSTHQLLPVVDPNGDCLLVTWSGKGNSIHCFTNSESWTIEAPMKLTGIFPGCNLGPGSLCVTSSEGVTRIELKRDGKDLRVVNHSLEMPPVLQRFHPIKKAKEFCWHWQTSATLIVAYETSFEVYSRQSGRRLLAKEIKERGSSLEVCGNSILLRRANSLELLHPLWATTLHIPMPPLGARLR